MIFKRFISISQLSKSNAVLFEHKDKFTIYAAYFAIFGQAMFLHSIVELVNTQEDTEATLFGSKTLRRHLPSIGCGMLASIFPIAVYFGARKRVKSIQIIDNGRNIKVTNLLPFGKDKINVYRLSDAYTTESIGSQTLNNNWIKFHAKGREFLVDKSGSFYPDQNSFNMLFHRR
ncbi:hypothetical protein HDV04_002966 [Boothiomyces sp. JEL0838]|nr:hypothetical protein HDV04_002966 [Boothiomyces sp. JEL0838]